MSGVYSGKFGEKEVLTAKGKGAERFYVMALNDYSDSKFWWASSPIEGGMPTDFGKGKTNTKTLIKNLADKSPLWKELETISKTRWFVPSLAEWSAFARAIGITKENYDDYGLAGLYWSSSKPENYKKYAFEMEFSSGSCGQELLGSPHSIRLSTTF